MAQGVYFNEYGVTVGSSAANPRNVESIIKFPPTVNPDQLVPSVGPIPEPTADGGIQNNGTLNIFWYYRIMTHSDFSLLLNHIFGGFTVSTRVVSIRTRRDQNDFANYNCIAIRPVIGRDYQRGQDPRAPYRDVHWPFHVLVAY